MTKDVIKLARTSLAEYGPLEERSFSSQEFLDLLAYAELLHRADQRELLREQQSAHLTELGLELPGTISLSDVYDIAKTTQIPRQYLERALTTKFPSPEDQLEDLKHAGAEPSTGTILNAYSKYLIRSLQESFPLYFFESQSSFGSFLIYRIIKEKEEDYSFFRQFFKGFKNDEANKERITYFYFNDYYRTITIRTYSPLFLRVAEKTLDKLNKFFNMAPKIIQAYDVDLDHALKAK
mgnify:FL=1